MAFVLANRVLETTTTTGTGAITLAGTSTGFQSFAAVGNGNVTFYTITNDTDWEVGSGTYFSSGPTLTRDAVLESSNNNQKVDWGAGEKQVFVTYPASQAVYTFPPNIVVPTPVTATGSLGSVGISVPILIDYLVVAGGGGGGGDEAGGGGGAGGYRASTALESIFQNYTVTVGAGGVGGLSDNIGTNGSNSLFSSITSVGGGYGGANGRSNVSQNDGANGGSGGGSAPPGASGSFNNDVGTGTTGQGNNGGRGYWRLNDYLNGGGGGGAGSAGQDSSTTSLGPAGGGGPGIESSITGTAVYYAGGGGGAGYSTRTLGGAGGLGGGGNGANYPSIGSSNTAGVANTGGGGAGGGELTSTLDGTNGGSGVVILKYPDSATISNPGGGLTFTTSTAVSGFKITTFTAGTGNVQFL